MATCTAICFLGHNHPYGGGIQIMHMMRLYENDRLSICIEEPAGRTHDGKMRGVWWGTTSDVLDDMMLLAAVYALKDEKVISACREAGCPQDTVTEPWAMYDAKEKLPILYEMAKDAFKNANAKLVLVSLTGSQMTSFVDKAKGYDVDLELCPAVFERSTSVW